MKKLLHTFVLAALAALLLADILHTPGDPWGTVRPRQWIRESWGAQSAFTYDRGVFTASAVATSGGVFSATYAVPTDKCARLRVVAFATAASGGHLSKNAGLAAEGVVCNQNGTMVTPGAVANNANPFNSNTALTNLTGTFAEAADSANWNGIDTVVISTSGTNAVLTFTNNSTTTAANATLYVEVYVVGST